MNKNWIKRGLIWGGFMFLAMAILFPLAEDTPITVCGLLVKAVIWLGVGLGYGYFVDRWTGAKREDQ